MTLPCLILDLGPGTVKTHCSSFDAEKYKETNDALFFLYTFKTLCKSTSVIKSQLRTMTSV